jgi:hypothetical protein
MKIWIGWWDIRVVLKITKDFDDFNADPQRFSIAIKPRIEGRVLPHYFSNGKIDDISLSGTICNWPADDIFNLLSTIQFILTLS